MNRHSAKEVDQESHDNIISHQGNANQSHSVIYHFTPTRVAVIKKTANNMCLQGCG